MELVKSDNPILKQKGINVILEKEVDLINELVRILRKTGAVGIAAHQIGEAKNLFLMLDYKFPKKKIKNPLDGIVIFGNPKIIELSENKCFYQEGCLSYPNLILSIKRPKTVKVSYETIINDELNFQSEKIYDDLYARIIQHEYDHIDGITFVNKTF